MTNYIDLRYVVGNFEFPEVDRAVTALYCTFMVTKIAKWYMRKTHVYISFESKATLKSMGMDGSIGIGIK